MKSASLLHPRTIAMVAVGAIAGATLAATPARSFRQGQSGVTRKNVFAVELPNLPGQRITGVLVTYEPGGRSQAHHHTERGSVTAYVIEGEVRSQVNDGPVTLYKAGESWFEPPGAAHRVAENASRTQQAKILAIFVADSGATLTTVDPPAKP